MLAAFIFKALEAYTLTEYLLFIIQPQVDIFSSI